METVLENGVTVYGPPEVAIPLIKLVEEFAILWEDTGETVDIPEEQ